jgi:sugar phosphate isomerase/epimerase
MQKGIYVPEQLQIALGVKSDPVEYRYSYAWLFRIMAEEGVKRLQLGTFFELYHLPDAWFLDLRAEAAAHGIAITSLFTAHRELGGFFRLNPRWEAVARRNYERLIEVAALTGARHAGSNPGAVMRDEMDRKEEATACYLRHMKELQHYAFEKGLECITIEPMSCLAEPPMLPAEVRRMGEELNAYHRDTPGTVPAGFCADTSHGWADENRTVRHTHLELFEAALPWLVELHLKNTDALFNSTFGFSGEESARGIVDLAAFRDLLLEKADLLPVRRLTAYLEIGGPKLGRDYSDIQLEKNLRASLRHCREVFAPAGAAPQKE